ncbi:MAG TPA: tRNA lysidine(34) synthetase TilS [Rhodanobacteraceae bacterium]
MPTASLIATLQSALGEEPANPLCVAFSGGPDSTALLHVLAQIKEARAIGLRALHVDHGLHPDSSAWARHCVAFCTALHVPLTVVRATVHRDSGEGIEAAARAARYTAFAANLRAGEWLVLAHHRDDQIETVLLKLLRGAGPEGLGGMRKLRPLGAGSLWRPLLETPREDITSYLILNNIKAIDDPSNRDQNLTRNWLRHTLLPIIQQRQPNAGAAILHAADLCRTAANYMAAVATAAGATLTGADGTLEAAGWLALPAALRAPVLDAWLRTRHLPPPPDRARAELASQIAHAAIDRVPTVGWASAEVRIWRGRLYASPPLQPVPADWNARWDGTPLVLPTNAGTLSLLPNDHARTTSRPSFDSPLTVRFSRPGERLLLARNGHHHLLSELLRNAGLPPWWRARCPLIHAGAELLAAGDVVISAAGERTFAALGVRPCWQRSADV